MLPIGVIHSPFTEKEQTPIQSTRSQATGSVEVYPEFAAGLQDLDGFSHTILLYVFHHQVAIPCVSNPSWTTRSAACLPRVILLVPIRLGFNC